MLVAGCILGIIWLLIGIPIEIVIICELTGDVCPCFSPSELYKNTKMNWFGCWFIFIVFRLTVPVNTLIILVTIIMYYSEIFFKWLFTVGRKDEE